MVKLHRYVQQSTLINEGKSMDYELTYTAKAIHNDHLDQTIGGHTWVPHEELLVHGQNEDKISQI